MPGSPTTPRTPPSSPVKPVAPVPPLNLRGAAITLSVYDGQEADRSVPTTPRGGAVTPSHAVRVPALEIGRRLFVTPNSNADFPFPAYPSPRGGDDDHKDKNKHPFRGRKTSEELNKQPSPMPNRRLHAGSSESLVPGVRRVLAEAERSTDSKDPTMLQPTGQKVARVLSARTDPSSQR